MMDRQGEREEERGVEWEVDPGCVSSWIGIDGSRLTRVAFNATGKLDERGRVC